MIVPKKRKDIIKMEMDQSLIEEMDVNINL